MVKIPSAQMHQELLKKEINLKRAMADNVTCFINISNLINRYYIE